MIDKLNLSETTSQAERQRRYIFFYTCAGYMAGILWSFFSDAAPRTTFYHSINALHLGLLLVLMLLFLSEKATTEKLTALFLVITQAEISFEMIYEAVSKSHTANLVIIGNMVLLALLLMISIASYYRIIPYLLGGASIATYALCTFLATEIFPFDFLPAYAIAFVGLGVMGARMNQTIRDISVENNAYRTERQSMLELFRMDTDQLTEFIHLARQKELTMEQTETLLELLDAETRQKLTDAITENIRAKTIELAKLEEKIPGLTPAEKRYASAYSRVKASRRPSRSSEKALQTSQTCAAGYAANSISNTTKTCKAVSHRSYTENRRYSKPRSIRTRTAKRIGKNRRQTHEVNTHPNTQTIRMERTHNLQDLFEALRRQQRIIRNLSGMGAVQSALSPVREMRDQISGGLRLYRENPAGQVTERLKTYRKNLFKGISTVSDPLAPMRRYLSVINRVNRQWQEQFAAVAASTRQLDIALNNALLRMDTRQQAAFGIFNAALCGTSAAFLKNISYTQTWQEAAIVGTTNSTLRRHWTTCTAAKTQLR